MVKTKKNKKKNNITKKIHKKNVFNDEDYNDDSGMLTSIWGPLMWVYLHTMSFNYPNFPSKENKKNYKSFIYNLRNVLPCKYCRINLKNNLKETPLKNKHLENRETFSRYIYNLHNNVNVMLGKPIYKTYEEVRENYENFRARCTDDDIKNKVFKNKNYTHKKGCNTPLVGIKSRCILRIVPKHNNSETLKISNECYKKRKKI